MVSEDEIKKAAERVDQPLKGGELSPLDVEVEGEDLPDDPTDPNKLKDGDDKPDPEQEGDE